jgi:hypothetical protein
MYKTYKISCRITGKIYFGYTSGTLGTRLCGHHSEPRNTLISRSLRKYGKGEHTIELLQECATEEEAKAHEIELIATQKTNIRRYPEGNGLNMTDGGEGCYGYKHTAALRRKWKQERKGKGTGPRMNRRGLNAVNSKRIYVFNSSGKNIGNYVNTVEAEKALGVHRANISKCCLGYKYNRSAGGYYFSFNETYEPRPRKGLTGVRQINPNTDKVVRKFSSISHAAKTLNVNRSGIDKCLKGLLPTCKGYRWERE